jgi:HD-GYP domain-containing protein (c-di-GMP phosphodiesterase class II)
MAAENESPSPTTSPLRSTHIDQCIDGAIESTLESVRAARSLSPPFEPSPNTETSVAARRLRHLSEIGLALSAERDIDRLLAMILSTSRQLTSSDGGTLYIVEKSPSGEKNLYFRAAQNDTIVVDTKMSFAVSPSSLAGYVALTGEILRFDDVYHLSPDAPYKFNPLFDVEHNYKTQSVLVVPLKNHIGEVIGVLQLINRKRHREVVLRDTATIEREVLGFDDDMVELAATLASQAAVALNNNLLLREIEDLFEALVVASASAIEDRDPTTSGHSNRVTTMTVELAKALSQAREGVYKDVHFSSAQLRELRYAGLLHDFGKIGVREAILTKSHKIEPRYFSDIYHRVLALRHQWEYECAQQKIDLLSSTELVGETRIEALEELDNILKKKINLLEADFLNVEKLNDPTNEFRDLQAWNEVIDSLHRLSVMSLKGLDGSFRPLLTPEEIKALEIRNGTLTAEEFQQIQAHAQMSFDFLEQIPWTSMLEDIPVIARSHHERLDGSGYPVGLAGDQIPLGARLMAIADVYDALTATDRPYKRSMSTAEALAVLQTQADIGKLDREALKIFIEKEIYNSVAGL